MSKYDIMQEFINIKFKLGSFGIEEKELDKLLKDFQYLEDSIIDILDFKQNK